ncbi:Amidase domain-containing protein [Aphelenchoides besseyi]|nr:Amidase domain-containing protein [Aphelenchoides besseyi]
MYPKEEVPAEKERYLELQHRLLVLELIASLFELFKTKFLIIVAGSIRLPALSMNGMIPNQLHGYQNEMAALGPMTRYACDLMPLFKIEEMRDKLRADIIELLGDNGVLIWPSFPQSSYHHNELLWNPFQGEYTAIWNALALPVISCPVGLNASDIPLGVQLVASPQNERLLIAAAVEIERAFGGHVLPPGKQK